MATGRMNKNQLIKIMDEAHIRAKAELEAANSYEEFQYASGVARGRNTAIHSFILAVFGLSSDRGDIFNLYTEYSAAIDKQIKDCLSRLLGVNQ
jgi:hypothetical protein